MNDFHFLRPLYLLLIIPAALILALLTSRSRQAGVWQKICSADLIPHILTDAGSRPFPYLFYASFLLLMITALAGPTWQLVQQPLIKRQLGFVIALDLSATMDADDIKPSRLQRAIYKINDLLKMQQEGQAALIVFSAHPFVVTPLTDDRETIKNLISSLETTIMPSTGHRVDLSLAKAHSLLQQGGIESAQVLLVTAELSDTEKEAALAVTKDLGIKVCILGVGTETTTPVPSPQGGFIKNQSGAIVTAGFSKKNLQTLADETQGIFTPITLDDSDLHRLHHELTKATAKEEQTSYTTPKWHDAGYMLALFALPFALLLFRRGMLSVLIFFMPHVLQAVSFPTLWQRQDQLAQQCFEHQNYSEASCLFENQEWRAASYYQLGDYEKASELFQGSSTEDALFNYGTARAKLGDFEKALEAYESVLKTNPDHEDARYNKQAIEEHLKNRQNQDQKNQNKQKKDKQNKKDQNQSGKPDQKNKTSEQESDQKDAQDAAQEDAQDDAHNEEDGQGDPKEDLEAEGKQQKDMQNDYRDEIDNELQKPQGSKETKQAEEEKEAQQMQEAEKAQEEQSEECSQQLQQQSDERWLKRIADDPSGLLRRKFLQQYQKNNR